MSSIQTHPDVTTTERAVRRAQCARGMRSAAILYYIYCKDCDLLCIV